VADKLTDKSWKAFAAKAKIDGAELSKKLAAYASVPSFELADRLEALAEVAKSLDKVVAAVKKDKALAANKEVTKYLEAMQKEAVDERRAIEAEKAKAEKEAAKGGLRKVDIQIIARNWDREPMRGYKIFARFKAPGFKEVALGKEIKGGAAEYDDVMLMPEGTVQVMAVSTGKATLAPEATIPFKLPKSGLMVFTAEQEQEEVKVRASSVEEATKKTGVKGEAGIDWKIFSAGVETSAEDERKKGTTIEVEYTVRLGKSSFKLEQTK
jgi:hypothetical protein